jgi:serine/threonine protein kinase
MMSNIKKIGAYTLHEKLGSGQFGEVYKAIKDGDLNSLFAIKMVPRSKYANDKKLEELIMTELSVMEKVRNPNVFFLTLMFKVVRCYESF